MACVSTSQHLKPSSSSWKTAVDNIHGAYYVGVRPSGNILHAPWVVLHPIVTFIGLSSASTHPNKLVVLSSRLLTAAGNPFVDAQVQIIKTIPKKVRHGLKFASLLSKITDSRTRTSSAPVKLCVARVGIRVDLRCMMGGSPASRGTDDVQHVDTASMSRVVYI